MSAADVKTSPDFLSGGGEMGSLIRGYDWALTPLGAIGSWPQSLKTSVSLILSSRHPMWIGWGPEMTFLYNDAYLHVLGHAKHPHALGMPASQVWAEIWDVCGPLADRVFEKGEATFVDDVRLFMDRGTFLEETFYSFSYSPIRDESGRVSGLFCPSTDVTPKVLNARRLKTLSELASHALIEKTAERACEMAGSILAKNPDDLPFALLYLADATGDHAVLQASMGAFTAEFSIQRVIDLTADSNTSLWPIAEVLRTGERRVVRVDRIQGLPLGVAGQAVVDAVIIPVTSRGEQRPYGVLIAGVNPCRLLDPEYLTFFDLVAGQIATGIQNARAVEDEKRRADMLAEIDRAKTVFFSNVSHEFRTPLTLMLGPIEKLLGKRDRLEPGDQEELLIAHRNSLRLLRLVNSLLDFSRIESGRIRASFAPAELSAFTAELASNFRSAMQAAGLEFIVDCRALPEPVYVDMEMWEKIVLNLLSNAFKFTFDGSITVTLRAVGDRAVLTVADTGTGIPESELPRIFDRFYRVGGTRGRTHEGTGIGLALIQELVKLHGGVISVTSRLGEGSTFTVELPFGVSHLPPDRIETSTRAHAGDGVRARAFTEEALTWVPDLSDGAKRTPRQEPAAAGARPCVLFADDNVDMREHVTGILGEEFEIITAEDGQKALALMRERRPDLLLSDVMMPDIDGLQLLSAVRADPELQTTPVVLLSARAGEDMRVEGLQAGADDYLVKPFTASELRARVATHVQMARTRRQALERETALRADAESARDQFTQVLESITDGFIGLDREWRFTYVNAESERQTGRRRTDLLGRNYWDVFPDAVNTTIHRELLRVATDRKPADFEQYDAPGKRWFRIKAYPAADGGVWAFYDDVTERRAIEEERSALLVREREARQEAETLNEVARSLSAELDLQNLVQTVTDAATKLTGAQYGAFFYNVVNHSGGSYQLYTLSGAAREQFEGIGMPRNTLLFDATFSGSGVVRCADITADPRYGKNSPHHGTPPGHLPVRSYLAVPVTSRSGAVLGGLLFAHSERGIFTERSERLATGIASHAAIAIDNAQLFATAQREIAQRREVEHALRESEARFRQLAEIGPQFIWITRPDGQIEYVNRRWTEYSGLDLAATNSAAALAGALHPDDHGELMRRWQSSLATGEPLAAESRMRGADGKFRWFVIRTVPWRDDAGGIVKWFGASTDIDEQKQVEDELRRANQDLEQFAYSASHDLKEPLRGVKIYSELLVRQYGPRLDGQALEFLGVLRGSADRMELLIRDLLAYTQVTRIERPPALSDTNEALTATLSNLKAAIEESAAQITYDPLPQVPVHSTHLKQLFQNLIGNAIKYRGRNHPPRVHVSSERQNGNCVFSVSDNGIGIEAEYHEKIFGLFKRLHTGDEYSGTGIGLAICQRIVERYRGRIWVESKAGHGSTFRFTVPV